MAALSRQKKILLATVAVVALAMLAVAFVVVSAVWSDSRHYVGAFEKAAARHLDKVSVAGFEFVGEQTEAGYTVERFWFRRTSPHETALAITYAGKRLNQNPPGTPPSRSRYEEELGWLALDEPEFPCSLTAYRIIEIYSSYGMELSDADKRSVVNRTATLVGVAVSCGGG